MTATAHKSQADGTAAAPDEVLRCPVCGSSTVRHDVNPAIVVCIDCGAYGLRERFEHPAEDTVASHLRNALQLTTLLEPGSRSRTDVILGRADFDAIVSRIEKALALAEAVR